MRYWLLFLGALLLSPGARAQRCGGGGAVSFEVLLPDGRPVERLTYELTSLEYSEDFRARLALATPADGNRYTYYHSGVPVSPANVEHLRPLLRPGRELTMLSRGPTTYQLTPVPKRGRVQNGLLTFYSKGQSAWEPCLLRLTDGQKAFYLVCNPFGNCRRTTTIYWEEPPRLGGTQED